MGDNESNGLFVVGKYNKIFNSVLSEPLNYENIYQSEGLLIHITKRHYKCLLYIDKVSEIIECPDFIGVNPNESEASIELIKCFEDNILVGIKVDKENDYLYVSTIHDITPAKIFHRLDSGRLKEFRQLVDNNSESGYNKGTKE